MAYDHYQIEFRAVEDGSVATAGDIGSFTPGYQPVIIRAVATIVTEAAGTAAGTVEYDFVPTIGSGTGRVQLASHTVATDATVGSVLYTDGLNQLVEPGSEIAVETDGGATGTGTAHAIVFYQPCWEHPDNNTDMTSVAAS